MKNVFAFIVGLFLCGAAYAQSPSSVLTVTNVSTLKSLGAAAARYPTVNVLGYYTANDGGGGLVQWNSSSTATADDAYIFQATAVSTGRYYRILNGTPMSILQCGAKADNSTNNTARLQACFDSMSANNLGEIICPAAASNYRFAGPVTPVGGGSFRGVATNQQTYLGASTSPPGACHLYHTGTGKAFDFQTPFQSIAACPNTVGPKFYNFVLEEGSTGNSIRINDASTAGFSDDCAGTGGGQSQVFGTVIDGVTFTSAQRGTTAVELNKAFDTTITNSTFSFYDTQVLAKGSDNVEIFKNYFNFATLREVDLVSSGTFGNYNNIRDNTFFSPYTNATDFIRSSARSGVIDGNYFEADFTGITNVLNLTCALSQTATNNTMALLPANVQYWLSVTGDCTQITLTNNYPLGGGNVPSTWNAGAGSHWFTNGTKQKIVAWGNPDDSNQLPYYTKEPVPIPNNAPAISGSVIGNFDATSIQSIGGNFASSITVGAVGFAGGFLFTPQSAPNGHITFKFQPKIQGLAYDLWILAATGSGSNQQIIVADGTTTATTTLSSGTTPTWYKVITNGVVNDPTIATYNNDTGHGQNVYVYQWQMVQH